LLHPAANPLGSLTPAEAPLINAENLFRQPGPAHDFFEQDLFDYVEPEATTGQHLRFAPQYIEARLGWRGQSVVRDLHWDPHARDLIFEELKEKIGVAIVADGLSGGHFRVSDRPPTHLYVELRAPQLEIIIDIHPRHWSERYLKRRSYHKSPVIYRKSGPATVKAGVRIQEASRARTSTEQFVEYSSSTIGLLLP
ncbi:hypothetical protein IVA80_04690, partial [Bradyrhizobium sp. 139]|uniref:hypothetical protein n=1 Tax=Bradyrhizobium sp. 139 TaxID=2782616 RepID=UPI001FF8FC5B